MQDVPGAHRHAGRRGERGAAAPRPRAAPRGSRRPPPSARRAGSGRRTGRPRAAGAGRRAGRPAGAGTSGTASTTHGPSACGGRCRRVSASAHTTSEIRPPRPFVRGRRGRASTRRVRGRTIRRARRGSRRGAADSVGDPLRQRALVGWSPAAVVLEPRVRVRHRRGGIQRGRHTGWSDPGSELAAALVAWAAPMRRPTASPAREEVGEDPDEREHHHQDDPADLGECPERRVSEHVEEHQAEQQEPSEGEHHDEGPPQDVTERGGQQG